MKKPSNIHCNYDKLVHPDKLLPHPKNPNRHPENQIKLLADILSKQGWRSPVVVSNLSGFIVAGHGRVQAAIMAGIKQVPVNYQDFHNEETEIAHLLADNRLAELSDMDDGALLELLKSLEETEAADLSGFDDAALAALLADCQQVESPDDFKTVDENIETEHQCPKCAYKWSGKSNASND